MLSVLMTFYRMQNNQNIFWEEISNIKLVMGFPSIIFIELIGYNYFPDKPTAG